MKRRTFLQVVAGAAMAWPMRVTAQQDVKLPLVAVLYAGLEAVAAPRPAACPHQSGLCPHSGGMADTV